MAEFAKDRCSVSSVLSGPGSLHPRATRGCGVAVESDSGTGGLNLFRFLEGSTNRASYDWICSI